MSVCVLQPESGWAAAIEAAGWSVLGRPDMIDTTRLEAGLAPAKLSDAGRDDFLKSCRSLVKRAAGGGPETQAVRLEVRANLGPPLGL